MELTEVEEAFIVKFPVMSQQLFIKNSYKINKNL